MIIGLDIGGTTVKIGFIDGGGEIIEKWEIPTDRANQGKSIVQDITDSIMNKLMQLQLDKQQFIGIGAGAPGFINATTGFVYEAVNVGWKNFDLAGLLQKNFGLPIFVSNDANVAVLGENWKGAGGQAKNILAVTIGTGVGGGVIAGGKLIEGVNGTAGEIGHITVERNGSACNCGRNGCLETVASATGIVRQAMESIRQHPQSALAKYYEEQADLTTKDIFRLAGNGDKQCKEILEYTFDMLGLAVANMGLVINPSKILIGGGVSAAGEPMLQMIDSAFQKYALPRVYDVCDMGLARLGNDAGIIGAAFLVKQKLLGEEF
jgi:glucokinase